jgi:hypothetical protein
VREIRIVNARGYIGTGDFGTESRGQRCHG